MRDKAKNDRRGVLSLLGLMKSRVFGGRDEFCHFEAELQFQVGKDLFHVNYLPSKFMQI